MGTTTARRPISGLSYPSLLGLEQFPRSLLPKPEVPSRFGDADYPVFYPEKPLALRPMALTLLAERRKPFGECLINTAKPGGSRPAATKTNPKVSAIGLTRRRNHDAERRATKFANPAVWRKLGAKLDGT